MERIVQNSLHFLFTAANKNRKQAAKPAEDTPDTPVVPEGGYVIPEGAKTYTVEVDVAGYVEVQDKYNVADLIAGADPEATIQMAYLNENGEMAWQDWTVTDGWFGVEGAHGWGEGCVACIKPNADGTFAYIAAFSGLEVGASATAIFNYGNDVIVAITANVVASPELPDVPSIEIEADYTLELEVAQDNGYGNTYFALDGTVMSNWGSYSDPDKYVTTIEDKSVDITAEIEAALGIEIGTLKDEISAGTVYMGAYALDADGNVVFNDCYETKGSGTFYWFTESGYATGWGDGAYACIDVLGFATDAINLHGYVCLFPNRSEIGTTYSTYVVFKTEEAEYVVEIKATGVETPEKQPLPEMEIVKTYDFEFDALYVAGEHKQDNSQFSLQEYIADIESLIGAPVDQILMSLADGTFQDWAETDGWFGAEGATKWGNGSIVFMKPNTDGSFKEIGTFYDLTAGDVANCTYRYASSATLKAVDINFTVTVVE